MQFPLKLKVKTSKLKCVFLKNLRFAFPEKCVCEGGLNFEMKYSSKLVDAVLDSKLSSPKFLERC